MIDKKHLPQIANVIINASLNVGLAPWTFLDFDTFQGRDRVLGEELIIACRTDDKAAATQAIMKLTGLASKAAWDFVFNSHPKWK